MKRRNLCSVGVGLLLLIPATGHAQSAEQLGHCTELINRSSQLLDGEQTILWLDEGPKRRPGRRHDKPNFFSRVILQVIENMVSAEGIEPSTY